MLQCSMPITVQNVVDTLALLGGRASIHDLHNRIGEVATPPLPQSARQIIRARLQNYCAASTSFAGRGDYFRNVYGFKKRRGIWELTADAPVGSSYIASTPGKVILPAAKRNPAWSRDELILALDLYMTSPNSPPAKESAAVVKLSSLLRKMQRLTANSTKDTYRNANGIYLKMMNLRALDPLHTSQGRVGMQSMGRLDRVVWNDYVGRREDLAADAAAIRQAVEQAGEEIVGELPSLAPYEAEEGGVVLRLHKRYERDRKLVDEKLQSAKLEGSLACEVCSFDYGDTYGSIGVGYIEVHHLTPVHAIKPGQKTKLSDLALLCANCHRMAHRKRQSLSIASLKGALRGRG